MCLCDSLYIYVYVHISHDLKGYGRTTVYPCGACDKVHLKHSVFSFRDLYQALALQKGLLKFGKVASILISVPRARLQDV